jgi:hypothetical protein
MMVAFRTVVKDMMSRPLSTASLIVLDPHHLYRNLVASIHWTPSGVPNERDSTKKQEPPYEVVEGVLLQASPTDQSPVSGDIRDPVLINRGWLSQKRGTRLIA